MGGAVVLSSLADGNPPRIAGAILSAPAVWSREDMPVTYRVTLWLAAHTGAVAACLGRGSAYLAVRQYPDAAQAQPRSALSAHARADQVYGLVNLMDAARHAPEHLNRSAADPLPLSARMIR